MEFMEDYKSFLSGGTSNTKDYAKDLATTRAEANERVLCEVVHTGGIGPYWKRAKNRKEKKKGVVLKGDDGVNYLTAPCRFSSTAGTPFYDVVSHASASHAVLLDANGHVFSYGRNDHGQLGLGHSKQVDMPTQVSFFNDKVVVKAATGQSHTMFITESGEAYACGSNNMGQLGNALLKDACTPKRVGTKHLANVMIENASCGIDFSIVLSADGEVYTFGTPENGVLGHGTTHQTLASRKIIFQPQPHPAKVEGILSDRRIVDIKAGNVHVLAADDVGRVYSWGYGGHGMLGHNVQKDQLEPKEIEMFKEPSLRCKSLGAGASFSIAAVVSGEVYLWGKWKTTGDGGSGQGWMYPRSVSDLQGFNVRSVAGGATQVVAVSGESLIIWGQGAQFGELGYGPDRPRSATRPTKLESLEGIKVKKVACGYGHTLFLVDRNSKKLSDIPIYGGSDKEKEKKKKKDKSKKNGKGNNDSSKRKRDAENDSGSDNDVKKAKKKRK